ncbi:MAG TPA: DUF1844 domain-containing protein [Vicinamibacteria bacterium]|nr:DUF1844 domain-containing protein [Vicinamibacteria bacterium]
MSDEKKPFTVNDRRHFTSEGEARAEVATPRPLEREPVAAPAPEDSLPDAGAAGSLDFIGLLVSLGAQASALLGLGEAPDAEERARVDLAGARGIIGLLEMLDRKTEGRRTPEEDQVLARLLYELRMAYLARAR